MQNMNDIEQRMASVFVAITKAEAARDYLAVMVSDLKNRVTRLDTDMVEWEAARDVVIRVMLATQGKIKTFVEDVVSKALATVYGSNYAFELEYDQKRNQVEATPWIVIDGERNGPRDEIGGGVLDVASLAMRLAVWALTDPLPSRTFLLDEPSKFVSVDMQPEFGRMLAELADMLDIQFVVVTHSPEVAEQAGRAYTVVLGKDGVSRVAG